MHAFFLFYFFKSLNRIQSRCKNWYSSVSLLNKLNFKNVTHTHTHARTHARTHAHARTHTRPIMLSTKRARGQRFSKTNVGLYIISFLGSSEFLINFSFCCWFVFVCFLFSLCFCFFWRARLCVRACVCVCARARVSVWNNELCYTHYYFSILMLLNFLAHVYLVPVHVNNWSHWVCVNVDVGLVCTCHSQAPAIGWSHRVSLHPVHTHRGHSFRPTYIFSTRKVYQEERKSK